MPTERTKNERELIVSPHSPQSRPNKRMNSLRKRNQIAPTKPLRSSGAFQRFEEKPHHHQLVPFDVNTFKKSRNILGLLKKQ